MSPQFARSGHEIKWQSNFICPVLLSPEDEHLSVSHVARPHIFKSFVEKADKEAHSEVPSSPGKGMRLALKRPAVSSTQYSSDCLNVCW